MKLTNKAVSLQRPHVSLDGERVALLDRDETLDIILDEGSHTLTVDQPFSKKVTIAVKQEEAYMIKGNPWHLIMRLIATAVVLFVSLSPLFSMQMPLGVALTFLILALLINLAGPFLVSMYRLEPMKE